MTQSIPEDVRSQPKTPGWTHAARWPGAGCPLRPHRVPQPRLCRLTELPRLGPLGAAPGPPHKQRPAAARKPPAGLSQGSQEKSSFPKTGFSRVEGKQVGKQQSSLQRASGRERGRAAPVECWCKREGASPESGDPVVPGPGDPADIGPPVRHWAVVGPLLATQVVGSRGRGAPGNCSGHRERETAAHSRILVWRTSWTEEPGGSRSVGSHRVGHRSCRASSAEQGRAAGAFWVLRQGQTPL